MMVVDTNVVSALMKQSPSGVVRDWMLGQVPAAVPIESSTESTMRIEPSRCW